MGVKTYCRVNGWNGTVNTKLPCLFIIRWLKSMRPAFIREIRCRPVCQTSLSMKFLLVESQWSKAWYMKSTWLSSKWYSLFFKVKSYVQRRSFMGASQPYYPGIVDKYCFYDDCPKGLGPLVLAVKTLFLVEQSGRRHYWLEYLDFCDWSLKIK